MPQLNLNCNKLILGENIDDGDSNIVNIGNTESDPTKPLVRINGIVPADNENILTPTIIDKLTTYYFTEITLSASDVRGSDGNTFYPYSVFTDQLTEFYPFDGNGLQKAGKKTLQELADTVISGEITVRFNSTTTWTPTEWTGTGDRPTAPIKPTDDWAFPSFLPLYQNSLITWRNLMYSLNYPLTNAKKQLYLPRYDTAPVVDLETPAMVSFNSVLDPQNVSGGDFFPNIYRYTDGQHQGTEADPCLTGLRFVYRGNSDNTPNQTQLLPTHQLVYFKPTLFY